MKKVIQLILVLALLTTCAFADMTVGVTDAGKVLTVVVPETDHEVVVEDENVIAVSNDVLDSETGLKTVYFKGVSEGTTRIRVNDDEYAESIAVSVDADQMITILSVVNSKDTVENVAAADIEAEDSLINFTLNGTGWAAEIENDDVVGIVEVTENTDDDTTTVTIIAMEPGVSDVVMNNGIDEEYFSIFVDEDGNATMIDTTINEVNDAFFDGMDYEINDGVMTITRAGNWTCVADDAAVVPCIENDYDAEKDQWTATLTAGADGYTDLTITNGEVTAVMTVYVSEGNFVDVLDAFEDFDDLSAYMNPANYTCMLCDEIFTMNGEVYLAGYLGEITEEGPVGFGEEDYAIFALNEDATIMIPANFEDADAELTACENVEAYVAAVTDEAAPEGIIVTIEVNENLEITSLTFVGVV